VSRSVQKEEDAPSKAVFNEKITSDGSMSLSETLASELNRSRAVILTAAFELDDVLS